MKHIFYSLLVAFSLLLTGCADAGKDQTVNAQTAVTLNGTNSTASVGGILKRYRWRQIQGPKVVLSDARTSQAHFTAPVVTEDTTLIFRLKTVEIGGHPYKFRSRDTVRVMVKSGGGESDTTAPVITLNGTSTVELTVGDTYTELGATAVDDRDGNVSVSPEGTVDTSTVGTYTITYTASDSAGNTATAMRTVTVKLPVDIIPPVITLNGAPTMELAVGDTYTELGATAVDDRDGNVSVEINGTVNTAQAGNYTVTYTASDSAGNKTTATRTVTVHAQQNIAPTAIIFADKAEIRTGDTVHFSSESSSDADGQIVAYAWEDDTESVLSQESSFAHTFTRVGTFGIKLIVTDDDGAFGDAIVFIHVVENNETNASGAVHGVVTDANGTAISGARIAVGEYVTITNQNGSYTLNVPAGDRILVDATHPDYLANSRVAEVNGTDVTQNITLDTPKVTLTFSAADGATVSQNNGASVELPANGYVDANGTAYTGMVTVKMSYHAISTQSGRATFPGTFEGIEGNETFPIQSYGFMNVELADENGNSLNLDGNSIATLTYPRDTSLNAPSTVPLWYYDKTKGYWVQEGEATNSGHYSTYVGTVTHFTSWNLDAKGPRARFIGCVEDENGTRVPGASVHFRSTNWDSYIKPTDANGEISVYNILAQTNLTFSAHIVKNHVIFYGDKTIYLNEGEEKVDNTCLVLTPQTNLPGTITVTGILIDYFSNQPAINQPVYVSSGVYPYTQIASSATDSSGTFSITFQTVDTLTYRVGLQYTVRRFTLQANKSLYDLGSITINEPQ